MIRFTTGKHGDASLQDSSLSLGKHSTYARQSHRVQTMRGRLPLWWTRDFSYGPEKWTDSLARTLRFEHDESHHVGIASEARMHAAGYRSTVLVLIATLTLTLGCRGSRSFERYVQVTKGDDANLPEIPAPGQRLTTAKPRSANDTRNAMTAELNDDSPHVTRTASQKTPTKTKATEARQASTKMPSSDSAKNPAAKSSAQTADKIAKETPKEGDKAALLAEVDRDQLMEAFSDYPPEVQREALRRLVAATNPAADQTSQPNDPQQQLAKSMQNLPKLPAAKNRTPDTPPTRIATSGEAQSKKPSAAMASISDVPSKDESVSGGLPDSDNLVTTEVESASAQPSNVSAKPDSKTLEQTTDQEGTVQTVSASRSDDDKSMIARAAAQSDANEVSGTTIDASEALDLSQDALFAKLLTELATAPQGESEAEKNGRLIRLRHLMVLSGDPDAAVEKIEGMSDAEQEFLRHQLLGLWTMIDPQGHPVPSRRFTTAIPQIREAAKFAAAATDSLEVRSLAFCTEIESYGQIKSFPGNRFDSGQQVILYCEIENFSVQKVERGFETHLQGSYDIYNSDNEKVVSQLLPADQQVSSNYLRDYFIAYQMHLPQQLSAGTYRMQLTMEDVNGKKYGQASIPFEIAK
ncbi:MAG: hypothetical protein ACR2NZ_07490 [Rubripirellula sp.]